MSNNVICVIRLLIIIAFLSTLSGFVAFITFKATNNTHHATTAFMIAFTFFGIGMHDNEGKCTLEDMLPKYKL